MAHGPLDAEAIAQFARGECDLSTRFGSFRHAIVRSAYHQLLLPYVRRRRMAVVLGLFLITVYTGIAKAVGGPPDEEAASPLRHGLPEPPWTTHVAAPTPPPP